MIMEPTKPPRQVDFAVDTSGTLHIFDLSRAEFNALPGEDVREFKREDGSLYWSKDFNLGDGKPRRVILFTDEPEASP